EELLVGNAARAVGLTVLREQQHQIDVGGEIELAPAELAHADDDERLSLAARGAWLAVARHECATGVAERGGDRSIREGGEIAALDEAGKDLRVTRAGLRHEVARAEDRSNRVANGERRPRERLSRDVAGVERFERPCNDRGQLGAERRLPTPAGQFQMLPPRS